MNQNQQPETPTESQGTPPTSQASTSISDRELKLLQKTKDLIAKKRSPPPPALPNCKKCCKPKTVNSAGVCISCNILPRIGSTNWVKCPKCGKEWSRLSSEGECYECVEHKRKEKEYEAVQKERLRHLFRSDEAVERYTFENWKKVKGAEEAYKYALNFDPKRNNAYIFGEPGRGKTHLSYAAAIASLKRGVDVELYTPRELNNRFRGKSGDDAEKEMNRIACLDMLVIDDIGTSKSTEFAIDVLADIIAKRALGFKNGLLVTSNLDIETLARKNNDDRLTSRIIGLCDLIEIKTDRDYRVYKRQI